MNAVEIRGSRVRTGHCAVRRGRISVRAPSPPSATRKPPSKTPAQRVVFISPSPRRAKSTRRSGALARSPKTATNKAKFILATDGVTLEAEDLDGGETVACAYPDFPIISAFS